MSGKEHGFDRWWAGRARSLHAETLAPDQTIRPQAHVVVNDVRVDETLMVGSSVALGVRPSTGDLAEGPTMGASNDGMAMLPTEMGDVAQTPPRLSSKKLSSIGSLPPELIAKLNELPQLDVALEAVINAQGEVLDDLVLLDTLGEGGMGQVWRAEQRSLSREVAIKRLKPGERRSSAIKALLHEGSILGNLAHPNVVPVYALAVDRDEQPFLVMKRIEGTPWQTLIREEDHAYWQRHQVAAQDRLVHHLEIFMKVCSALAFAHSQGILHRDIKPENIMVGDFGEVCLLDWGLAIRIDASHRAKRLTDEAPPQLRPVGTQMYLAPEMLYGDVAYVDRRTDVDLLAATLHEVLTGAPPHPGHSLMEALHAAFESKPHVYPSHTPQPLVALCHRGMHVDPLSRFADAQALHDALETYLIHRTSLRLAEVADERLKDVDALIKVRQGTTDEDTRRQLSATLRDAAAAAQFGLMQALHEWPDNPDALAALERVRALMCGYEIDCEHVESAAALLQTMATPDPALVQRLDDLRARLRARDAEHASLRHMRDDMNFEADPKDRPCP